MRKNRKLRTMGLFAFKRKEHRGKGLKRKDAKRKESKKRNLKERNHKRTHSQYSFRRFLTFKSYCCNIYAAAVTAPCEVFVYSENTPAKRAGMEVLDEKEKQNQKKQI